MGDKDSVGQVIRSQNAKDSIEPRVQTHEYIEVYSFFISNVYLTFPLVLSLYSCLSDR